MNQTPRRSRVSESTLEFDPAWISRLSELTEEALSQQTDGGRQILRAMRGAWHHELTACQRHYMHLYYSKRHTMHDIAVMNHVSIGTVSRTLARARNRLRRILQYYIF